MAIENRDLFNDLFTQLTNLTYRRTKGDSKLIEKAIDELNRLDYRYAITAPHKAALLVNQCCTLVHPDNEELVSKCCLLVTNFIAKQHVQIEGKTCSVVTGWCLEALRHNRNPTVVTDLLTTLETLLRSNKDSIYNFSHDIVKNGIVVKVAEDRKNPQQMLLAVQSLEVCTMLPEDVKANKNDFQRCLQIFNSYLLQNNEFEEPLRSKLLISCLTGLQNVLHHDSDYLQDEIGTVLGLVRAYMLYGVKGVDFIEPQKLMPSVSSVPEPTGFLFHEKRGGKVTKQRKPKSARRRDNLNHDDLDRDDHKTGYRPATALLDCRDDLNLSSRSKNATSESDFSDVEGDARSKLLHLHCKVRLRALNIFLDITRSIDRRTLFSYSVNFMPDGWPAGAHSLTSCILRDPSRTCRVAALNVLLFMLVESKLYLIQAEGSDKSTPFTTFSITLGSMLVELHRCLRLALNERSVPVLTQVLKCFAALVQATPYHRLRPGLLTRNVRSLKPFLDHKDGIIQALTLIVLGCILASDPVVPEALKAFSRARGLDDVTTDTSESSVPSSAAFQDLAVDYAAFSSDEETEDVKISSECVPWMLRHCLGNLGVTIDESGEYTAAQNAIVPPVKLESLQIIAAMSSNYFTSFVTPYLHFILRALELSLENRNTDVKLHAGKTINFIGQGVCQYFANNLDKTYLTVEQGLVFWNALLTGPVSSLIEHDNKAVRAVACDCLASIGEEIFECLSKDKQMLVMMTLLASSKDQEAYVRSAAIRALGVVVTYPTLREDIGFVIDTVEAILWGTNDDNVGIQVRAYWSLGNISETLALNTSNSDDTESLPKSLWVRLFECGIKGTEDHYKYQTNAVRALGNFIFIRTEEDLSDDMCRSLVQKSIKCLMKCAANTNNAKVRWNACYALGRVMKNEALYRDSTWQTDAFRVLLDLVVSCKNFKVRINSALALSCLPTRHHYGNFYNETWISLLKALENSENMEDFTEYKHRDHLVDQICLSIGRLCSILEQSDLNFLSDSVRFYEDLLKVNMQKVYRRLVPEKSCHLLVAEEHLGEIMGLKLGNEQTEVVKILSKIFNSEVLKE